MAFPSINSFKEQLLDGGARAHLFDMQITWPISIPVNVAAAAKMPWHCRISEIPGETLNQIPFKYAGREIKFAATRMYENLRLTVINDEGFTVRKGLETWVNFINTRESNISLTQASPTAGGYGGIGVVRQYGKDGNVKRIITFIDMWPVRVEPIPLDWSNDAAIEEYGVEFAYQYWEPGNLSASTIGETLQA